MYFKIRGRQVTMDHNHGFWDNEVLLPTGNDTYISLTLSLRLSIAINTMLCSTALWHDTIEMKHKLNHKITFTYHKWNVCSQTEASYIGHQVKIKWKSHTSSALLVLSNSAVSRWISSILSPYILSSCSSFSRDSENVLSWALSCSCNVWKLEVQQ